MTPPKLFNPIPETTLDKRIWAMGVAVFLGAMALVTPAPSASMPQAPTPTPDGYDAYLVFMSDGVTTADGFFADPRVFQEDIMGRSDQEVLDDRDAAVAFFADRFGIDFSGVVTSDPYQPVTLPDGSLFMGFMISPDVGYRAYTMSGRTVPSRGWPVRDGGWMAVAGSDYPAVPAGGFVVFGNYNVLAKRRGPPAPTRRSEIVLDYQSLGPMVPDAMGGFAIVCELFSEELGAGLAQGVYAPKALGGGLVQQAQRNVLTFPGAPTASRAIPPTSAIDTEDRGTLPRAQPAAARVESPDRRP